MQLRYCMCRFNDLHVECTAPMANRSQTQLQPKGKLQPIKRSFEWESLSKVCALVNDKWTRVPCWVLGCVCAQFLMRGRDMRRAYFLRVFAHGIFRCTYSSCLHKRSVIRAGRWGGQNKYETSTSSSCHCCL